jgi:copper chaperone NosL
MIRLLLLTLLTSVLVWGENISPAKYANLVKKGEKIALKLCDTDKLFQIKALNLPDILKSIDKVKPCMPLNRHNKEALAYFLLSGDNGMQSNVKGQLVVPKEAKCPVCGMFVAKYPKWAALIAVKEHKHYFDGVKDMMKFYIFDVDFPYNRTQITRIEVTDFYTLQAIDAKKAFYVIGSDVYGPMGNELIPFDTYEAAENFMKDHNGKKIILFDKITAKLVMGLDGIEYTE